MNVSMDDLISAFSSNHVGQEAMDLAALQTQLSQAFAHDVPRESCTTYHCNTPTTRTPSASFSWGQAMDIRTSACRQQTDDFMRELDDTEDERMVEDLLVPPSPGANASRKHSTDLSSFTSTDPFYIAQLQALQHSSSPPSVFSQFGRPSQQSSFQTTSAAAHQSQTIITPQRSSRDAYSPAMKGPPYLLATSVAFET